MANIYKKCPDCEDGTYLSKTCKTCDGNKEILWGRIEDVELKVTEAPKAAPAPEAAKV